MKTHTIITFPYNGYKKNSQREKLFWDIVQCCLTVNQNKAPLVVLNRDTEKREQAKSFLNDTRTINDKLVQIRYTWAVDTCQMWLDGWGSILDNQETKNEDRIVLLPGDIDSVANEKFFMDKLKSFVATSSKEIVIGDFYSGDKFNAKELIDLYGTYALMANWFPSVAKGIHKLPLNKPRSEFINIQVKVLRELLTFRKFSYEQTLNMLIRSWDFSINSDWKYKPEVQKLGELKDDTSSRQYRDCLDQIERTERMLKLLWREIKYPKMENSSEFIDLYDNLDRNSTSIRENSRIIIRNFLELG